jgi:hypothetical protein
VIAGLDYLLEVLAARGLALRVSHDGVPSLRGDRSQITDALRGMLAAWRGEILAIFPREAPPTARPREWLFPSGAVLGEPESHLEDAGTHPCRATHWRYKGEDEWHPITREQR